MRPKMRLGMEWSRGWLLAGAALTACSGGGHHLRPDEAAVAQQQPASAGQLVAPVSLINLPPALGLRQGQFSARFGGSLPLPTGFLDPGKDVKDRIAAIDSQALFRPHGLPMIVSFGRNTGHVRDVLLLGSDEAVLMRQAALLPDAPRYVLLPVFQPRHPERLLGLRVIPK